MFPGSHRMVVAARKHLGVLFIAQIREKLCTNFEIALPALQFSGGSDPICGHAATYSVLMFLDGSVQSGNTRRQQIAFQFHKHLQKTTEHAPLRFYASI